MSEIFCDYIIICSFFQVFTIVPLEIQEMVIVYAINGPRMFATCSFVCKAWYHIALQDFQNKITTFAIFARTLQGLHMIPTTYIPQKPNKQWLLLQEEHV